MTKTALVATEKEPAKSFPVPTVRLIVPNIEGEVLILKRSNTEYSNGAWCLPGGKVDYGDTVEATVIKELREETALKCIDSRFLFYDDSLPPTPGEMHVLNLYFECSAEGEIRLNDESSKYAWIGRNELSNFSIVFRNDIGLKRYWKQGDSNRDR